MPEQTTSSGGDPARNPTDKKNTILKILGFITALAVLWVFKDAVIELLRLAKDRDEIVDKVKSIGIWGPIILAIAIFLQMIVAMIPGHLLMFAAGYVYGFWPGFLLAWIVTIIGGQFTFYLARKAGKPIVYRLASPELVDKWEKVAQYQGVVFYIFSLTVPIFPADVMCYVAGFADISPRRFLIANTIGHIPAALLMSLAGAYGFKLSAPAVIVIIIISIVMLYGWWKYKDRVNPDQEDTESGQIETPS